MTDKKSFQTRTVLYLMIALTLTLLLIHSAGSSPAGPSTITVDNDGGQDYTTIQQAIDNASDGDIIQVSPGTYNENVNVDKQLTLISTNGSAVTHIVASCSSGSAVTLDHDSVTISGFNISGSTDMGISGIYISSSDNSVSNNKITKNNMGIYISSSDNLVTDNTISENNEGICAHVSSGISVMNNTINDSYGSGIYLSTFRNCILKNNSIYENYYGIFLYKTENSTIEHNTLSKNSIGLIIMESNNNTAINNRIISNSVSGLELNKATESTIYNNYFNNSNNVKFTYNCSGNVWNISKTSGQNIAGGPYLGGNYWLRPNGTGFSQINNTDLNSDGICDEAYTLQSGQVDHLPLATASESIKVDDDGGQDYTTIQQAIDNASNGDIIQVYPGTYTENIDVDKQLTITSTNGPSGTSIVATSANNTAIYLTHDNITIDGFTISGATLYGIYVYSNNSTISNNIISGNYNGVMISTFKNNRLINNTISNNSYRGIGIYFTTGNSIINNTCKDNPRENIIVKYSDGNTLTNNTLTASQFGLTIESSRDNIFRNNSITTRYGIKLDNSSNDIDTSNTINGKPIYYLKNQRDISIGATADPGMVYCLNCTNITLKDLNLTNNFYAIHLCNTTDSTIENNTLSVNYYGINLFDSSHNRIVNNRLNNRYGFSFDNARENLIYNNILNNIRGGNFVNNCTGNIWNTTKTAGQNIAGGSYLGGNYWLKPDGTGFSQINNTDLNVDGICDEAYTIYTGQIDYLPLALPDIIPPASITALSGSRKGITWINWTWTNPTDTDFNYTMVYLNGTFKANVTGTAYNATGLTDNTNYMLQTRTVDTAGNINSTWVNDTANTMNTLPPSSITGLSESTNGSTWINWTWTNPTDTDFNYTMVYLNGTFKANVTGTAYNATGLTDNTNYMLQTKTVDTAGNINSTWINDTASTLNTLPPSSITGLSESTNGSTWINWTWTSPEDTDFNYTMVYLNGTFKANVTGTAYNATGLTDNTNYMLQTRTVDIAGNINATWINDTASTLNTLPPASITNLSRSGTGSSWINWAWTNPTDIDHNYSMIFINGVFRTNVSGDSYTATNLQSSRNYEISIRTVDTAGNINTTWINDTATTTAESSGSRSSVGQSMPPQEVASTDTGVKKVLAGADVNFDLSSGEGPVLGISFKANSNEGNVVATVQVLNERPAGVTGEPAGRRYQTMSITVGREGTISKDNADNINIKFKVSKEWIRQNGIDPATIRMTRYHDGTWNDLPTDSVDEDDEYYYFSALTPGFSVFEVVGDEATQQTGQTSEVDTQPATSPEQQTTQQTVPEEEEEESGLPGFTAVWGTIMLSLAAVVCRYRK